MWCGKATLEITLATPGRTSNPRKIAFPTNSAKPAKPHPNLALYPMRPAGGPNGCQTRLAAFARGPMNEHDE